MKLSIPSLVVFLILLLCTSAVNAQELDQYDPYKSIRIQYRIPTKLESIRKTVTIWDKSETEKIDTIHKSITFNWFTDELKFSLPNFISLSKRKSKTSGESLQINGSFITIDTIKYLDVEFTFLKTEFSGEIPVGGSVDSVYKVIDIYTNIQCSKLVETGRQGSYTYKEGISGVLTSHRKVWQGKAHQEITVTERSIAGEEESESPPGISVFFR